MAEKNRIKIRQIRSQISRPQKQRLVLKGMGLGRIGKVVILEDTPSIRGMVNKVSHLVVIEEELKG